jgi:RNA-directed DNA polymerase
MLNPIIRGWAQYHNHAVSAEVFIKLDYTVFHILFSWAEQRHPNKSFNWIINKYWHKSGSKKYVFCTHAQKLENLSNFKIVRHRLAKLHKNPYIDKNYFDHWKIMEYYRKKRLTKPNSVSN